MNPTLIQIPMPSWLLRNYASQKQIYLDYTLLVTFDSLSTHYAIQMSFTIVCFKPYFCRRKLSACFKPRDGSICFKSRVCNRKGFYGFAGFTITHFNQKLKMRRRFIDLLHNRFFETSYKSVVLHRVTVEFRAASSVKVNPCWRNFVILRISSNTVWS